MRVPVLHIPCVDAKQAHDICAGTLTHEMKAVEVTVVVALRENPCATQKLHRATA